MKNMFINTLYSHLPEKNNSLDKKVFIRLEEEKKINGKAQTFHKNLEPFDINNLDSLPINQWKKESIRPHLVINGYGQGTKKDEITYGAIIQFESDDSRPLPEKAKDWQTLGMPEPTVIVWTGNKSLHNYWVLENYESIEDLHKFQVQLLRKGKELGADGYHYSDSSIGVTATKTLRMPGFPHPKTGNEATIVECSEKKYTLQFLWDSLLANGYELRGNYIKSSDSFASYGKDIFTAPKDSGKGIYSIDTSPKLAVVVTVTEKIEVTDKNEIRVSLSQLISKRNREIFEVGSTHGYKNDESVRLIMDLIGCELWAVSRHFKIIKSAMQLFEDYCQRSGIPQHEMLSRYSHATNKKPNPANPALASMTRLDFVTKAKQDESQTPNEISNEYIPQGYDLGSLLTTFQAIERVKNEKERELVLERWLSESTPKQAVHGCYVSGDLEEFKRQLIDHRIIVVENPKRTGVVFTDFRSMKSVEKVLKGYSYYLETENYDRIKEIISELYLCGVGNNVFVERQGRTYGAGYYVMLQQQKIKPHLIINQKYLCDKDDINPNQLNIPQGTRLLALKSEMGTGKTFFLAKMIQGQLFRPLAIYSRITLVKKVAEDFGILCYTEQGNDLAAHREYLHKGAAICINSLKRDGYINFTANDWGGISNRDIVILDEIESTLVMLAHSATMKHNRGQLLNNFRQLIRNILSERSDSILILSDANLQQSTIDLMLSWAAWDVPQFVVENKWQYGLESQKRAYMYDDLSEFLGEMLEEAALPDKALYITSDTREAKSELSITATETIAHALESLNQSVIRIDAETQSTKDDKDFGLGADAKLIVAQLKERQAHLVASPTLVAGISFDEKHFSSVWGCFKGVVDIDSIQQQIERERQPVDRHLFINTIGKSCFTKLTNESLLAEEENLSDIINTKGLQYSIKSLDSKNDVCDNPEQVTAKMLIHEDIHFAAWRRKNCITQSFASRNLRVNVIARLQERGYTVIHKSPKLIKEEKPRDKKTTQTVEEVCKEFNTALDEINLMLLMKSQKEKAIFNEKIIFLFQASARVLREERLAGIIKSNTAIVNEALLKLTDRTRHEHDACKKYLFELWSKGAKCTVESYEEYEKRKANIDLGFIFQKESTALSIKTKKEDITQLVSGKKLNRDASSFNIKARMLTDNIGLTSFAEWTKTVEHYNIEDKKVKLLNAKLLEYKQELRIIFKCEISNKPDRIMANISNILSKTARKQKCIGQVRIDGKRVRNYMLEPLSDFQVEVYDNWEKATSIYENESKSSLESLKKNMTRGY